MIRGFIAALLVLLVFRAQGQDTTFTLDDDFLNSAQQWAKENLDDDALRALQDVDRDKVRKFLAELQKKFQGDYVVDLAPLKETAQLVVPLLEPYEETAPYAAWLKAQLDYLDVAEEFRLLVPAPKPEPGRPPPPPPPPLNPAPQKEDEIWIRKLSARPWPASAKGYVSKLKPIFTEEKVPPELVWLAEVESSFDPKARSPAGAAGLFQLMPATAKRYGLKTGWISDERADPGESAHAAAKYLKQLHGHYGDWRLALAAYNAGEGKVDEVLKRRKGRSFEDIATRLPAETQMYVPRVEATILRREGLKLSELEHRF